MSPICDAMTFSPYLGSRAKSRQRQGSEAFDTPTEVLQVRQLIRDLLYADESGDDRLRHLPRVEIRANVPLALRSPYHMLGRFEPAVQVLRHERKQPLLRGELEAQAPDDARRRVALGHLASGVEHRLELIDRAGAGRHGVHRLTEPLLLP